MNKNRTLILALLGVPVFGMLIAVAVIFYTKPDNMAVVFGVILFVAVQYILIMFFFMKRIEAMVKKEEAALQEEPEETHETPADEDLESEGQLVPEEKRVFPVDEKSS
jgi:large-conductance mechanosensitive channel